MRTIQIVLISTDEVEKLAVEAFGTREHSIEASMWDKVERMPQYIPINYSEGEEDEYAVHRVEDWNEEWWPDWTTIMEALVAKGELERAIYLLDYES